MIANSIFAAGAFVSLVAAIPLAQPPFPKRDIVWETHTEVALTTIPVTVTHWLEPGETAPADANVAPAAAAGNKQHYGHHGHGKGQGHGGYGQQPPAQPETTQTAAPAPAVSSPESAPPAPPAPSSYEQSTSQAPPPPAAPTSQAPPSAAPTTQAPPPAYTPPAQPQPQPSPSPAPSAPSSGGGSAPSGKEYTGDITHYDVGLGSCGQTHSNSDAVVAIPEGIMNNPANPNSNPLCGQTITIEYAGQEHTAEIVDTCGGCYATSIDLSPTLFEAVAPKGDGRVSDVKWWFNN